MSTVNFGKVAVLFGGESAEREVSLRSGQAVLKGLLAQGIDAHPFDPKERKLSDLVNEQFDRVFIVLHGRGGEDGRVQGALEWLGMPYTGSQVQGSAFAMDKVRSKFLFAGAGVPTAPFQVVTKGQSYDPDALLEALSGKVMVKPANEGSSIGMSKAETSEQLTSAIELAWQYDNEVLIEQWITGTEVTVAILNGVALPVIEMRTPNTFYDYQAKYQSTSTEYLCPAPLSAELTDKIQAVALRAFQLVGGRTWGRVDILIGQNEQLNVLEVNTVPGMTETSLVPKAAKAAGISFEQLVAKILEDTIE